MERKADDELAALKAKMGLAAEAPAGEAEPEPDAEAESGGKRPWWKIW